jgi:hypothetical protein
VIDWIMFIVFVPFFALGIAWECVCDFFERGRAFYRWLQ